MAEAIEYKWRRRAVREAMANDTDLQGTAVVAPYVVSRYPVAKKPAAIVVLGVSPGGAGRFGWRGGVIDRYTVDVFVNANAGGDLQEKADDVVTAVLGALTQAKLDAALAALSTPQTTITASAKITTPFQDVDEPGPEGQQHRSGDIEVEFRSTT
jgi:hypothetical protein